MSFKRILQSKVVFTFATLLIIFGAGFAAGTFTTVLAAQGQPNLSEEAQQAFAPLWDVVNLIESAYIDDVDMATVADGALRGAVDSLGDQFSAYMSAEEYDMMASDLEGEIEGIGVVIRTIEETGQIEVVGVLEGTPAQESGIQAGDIFAFVNDEPVDAMSQHDLAVRVRGPVGTTVDITMLRGEELIDFVVPRARIIVPNVESEVLDGNVAYLQLNSFSSTARQDIDAALAELDVNSRNGLIFDLRDNSGGLLSAAIEVASAFIEDGVIVNEEFGDGSMQVYETDGTYAGIQVPVVVLVNELSASASELVAGAMQDLEVAEVIGQTTFGKGTVQTWQQLSNGGGIRLTIARWLTPDGTWIHEQGVTPDVVIPWERTFDPDELDVQLQGALDYLGELNQISVSGEANPS
ncbi:MAG: S41 family peptidase [Pleurocapsa minor GSE-CHR-MK-17-07R]|jgi:carboxyl-terminal processing protease|nr:S41 family peptidase [Pleurocapsa minor GSE-CHR-MK 17-07R]